MTKTLLLWETSEESGLYLLKDMPEKFKQINNLFINISEMTEEQSSLLNLVDIYLTYTNESDKSDLKDWVEEAGATLDDVGSWLPRKVTPGSSTPACDNFIHCGFIF